MSVRITADLTGDERINAFLVAAPGALKEAIWKATGQSTALTADAIRAITPERTGRLARSITSTMRVIPSGAQGRIASSLYYARFVEFGTREHGRAQRMFWRGARASEPEIQGFYRANVDSALAAIG